LLLLIYAIRVPKSSLVDIYFNPLYDWFSAKQNKILARKMV